MTRNQQQVEPAAGDQEPSVAKSADDDAKEDAPAPAEPSGPETAKEESWVNWGTTKKDTSWEASSTETLSRDPRNWVAGESLHPGWVPVPGMPVEFRFGGFIELNLIHDFQNAGIPSGEFIPSLIPVPTDFTPNTEFDIRSTRFIFESRTKAKDHLGQCVPVDGLHRHAVRHARPRACDKPTSLSAGFLSDARMEPSSTTQTWPDIFDLEGPNAMTASRTEMVRYSYGIVKSGQQQVPDKADRHDCAREPRKPR